jgi:hypothetical protein
VIAAAGPISSPISVEFGEYVVPDGDERGVRVSCQ